MPKPKKVHDQTGRKPGNVVAYRNGCRYPVPKPQPYSHRLHDIIQASHQGCRKENLPPTIGSNQYSNHRRTIDQHRPVKANQWWYLCNFKAKACTISILAKNDACMHSCQLNTIAQSKAKQHDQQFWFSPGQMSPVDYESRYDEVKGCKPKE